MQKNNVKRLLPLVFFGLICRVQADVRWMTPYVLLYTTNTWQTSQTFVSSTTFTNSITGINGVAYTWPSSLSAGNCLKVDGSGNLSWASCGSGGGGGGSGAYFDGSQTVSITTFTIPYAIATFDGSFATITVFGATAPVSGSWIFQSSQTFNKWVRISSSVMIGAVDIATFMSTVAAKDLNHDLWFSTHSSKDRDHDLWFSTTSSKIDEITSNITSGLISLYDEGTLQSGSLSTVNCVGSNIACTASGSTGTVTISASGGSSGGGVWAATTAFQFNQSVTTMVFLGNLVTSGTFQNGVGSFTFTLGNATEFTNFTSTTTSDFNAIRSSIAVLWQSVNSTYTALVSTSISLSNLWTSANSTYTALVSTSISLSNLWTSANSTYTSLVSTSISLSNLWTSANSTYTALVSTSISLSRLWTSANSTYTVLVTTSISLSTLWTSANSTYTVLVTTSISLSTLWTALPSTYSAITTTAVWVNRFMDAAPTSYILAYGTQAQTGLLTLQNDTTFFRRITLATNTINPSLYVIGMTSAVATGSNKLVYISTGFDAASRVFEVQPGSVTMGVPLRVVHATASFNSLNYTMPSAAGTIGQVLEITGVGASDMVLGWQTDDTSAGGGGGSTLGIATGSAVRMTVISSPTNVINFSSATFFVSLTGGSTAFVKSNVFHTLAPELAQFKPVNFPQVSVSTFNNFAESSLLFDSALSETAYWKIPMYGYVTGSSLTVSLFWRADSPATTSGDIQWGVQVSTIQPEIHTSDTFSLQFASTHTVVDTHLGTNARRIHRVDFGFSSGDLGSEINDYGCLRLAIHRNGNNASDTMSGDGALIYATVKY